LRTHQSFRVFADHPALYVDLEFLRPGFAPKFCFKGFFNALLADTESGIAQDRVGLISRFFNVLGRNSGDIAQHMAENAAVGIDPDIRHIGAQLR